MDNEGSDELILKRMHQTRTALTDKLETLENQVVDAVQSAASAVAETVENVGEAVQDTVASVTDSVHTAVTTVQESLDLRLQVERHPWAIVGSAVAIGYLAERLLSAASGPKPRTGFGLMLRPWQGNATAITREQPDHTCESGSTAEERASEGAVMSPTPTSSAGVSAGLTELLGPEIARAKRLILGALLASVRDTIVRSAPTALRTGIKEIVDRVTEKLGGEVVAICVSSNG
jgi:hypothetical protein